MREKRAKPNIFIKFAIGVTEAAPITLWNFSLRFSFHKASHYKSSKSKKIMTVKDVIKKIDNAESIQISLSAEDWCSLVDDASVLKLEGKPEEVNGQAASFIRGEKLSAAKTVAFVLFCNPEDSLSMMSAISAEGISSTGLRVLYGVCCEPRAIGTVEMFIIYH